MSERSSRRTLRCFDVRSWSTERIVLPPALLLAFGNTTLAFVLRTAFWTTLVLDFRATFPVDTERFVTFTSYPLRSGGSRIAWRRRLPAEAPSAPWTTKARGGRRRHKGHRQILEPARRAPQSPHRDPRPNLHRDPDRAPGGQRFPPLPPFGARWDRALPAAVFDAFPVRPSRSTFDAALAAAPLVFLDRAIACLLWLMMYSRVYERLGFLSTVVYIVRCD